MVYDVRFIPNPFYIPEMRELTGNDRAIQEYVMKWDVSKEFLDRVTQLVTFLIPHYIKEGKNQLVISIGCTGGKHRSVTMANMLSQTLKQKGHRVFLFHRDLEKDGRPAV